MQTHWEGFLDSLHVGTGESITMLVEEICMAVGNMGSQLRGAFDLNMGSWVCLRLETTFFNALANNRKNDPHVSGSYKQHLCAGLLKACKGCHQMLFRVYSNCLETVSDSQHYDWQLKLEIFHTVLKICWVLQPEYKGMLEDTCDEDFFVVENKVSQFMECLDDLAIGARTIAPSENEILLDINQGFYEIKQDLLAAMNTRKPLFLNGSSGYLNSCK